jgi:hypothetical protein
VFVAARWVRKNSNNGALPPGFGIVVLFKETNTIAIAQMQDIFAQLHAGITAFWLPRLEGDSLLPEGAPAQFNLGCHPACGADFLHLQSGKMSRFAFMRPVICAVFAKVESRSKLGWRDW